MKSEILRQIEKNKKAYYSNMAHLKNESPNIPTTTDNDSYQNENAEYSFKESIHFTLNKLFLKSNFKVLFANQFAKKLGRIVKNSFTKLMQFNSTINQSINSKSDKAIDRFYQFGASIFEVNDLQNNELKLEAIHIYSGEQESKTLNDIQLPRMPYFKPFQIILRNIVIYLESDLFSFSGIKTSSVSNENKVLNYKIKSQSIKKTATFSTIKQAIKKKISVIKTNKRNILNKLLTTVDIKFPTIKIVLALKRLINTIILQTNRNYLKRKMF